MIVSSINRLLGKGSPNTVFRTIVPIRVKSFQRMRLGRESHVRKKMNEGLPSFTNFDAAPTVPRKRSTVGVLASLFHAIPNAVQWMMATIMSLSHFFAQATATIGRTPQMVCVYDCGSTAIAQSFPKVKRVRLFSASYKSHNRKASVAFVGQINARTCWIKVVFENFSYRLGFRHQFSPEQELVLGQQGVRQTLLVVC